MQIERLKTGDFEEAMETMATAFEFKSPRDFPMLLPQIYQPTEELMKAIYAIRLDGRIVSAVGVHPRDWQVGDSTLKLAGIGGVCTLHDYRGKGLMKAIMERCLTDMKAEGFHLSWLGGQRQRYQYYGYERCGNVYDFDLRVANLRHSRRATPDIRFEPMGGHYVDRVATARAFHEAKPIHVRRSQEDFVLYLLSGYCEPWFALDSDENVIGYFAQVDGGVREISSQNVEVTLDILHAWANYLEQDIHVVVQPDDVSLARSLGQLAERVSVNATGNWQVFDWRATLRALLEVRRDTQGISEGKLRIQIDETRLDLEVCASGVNCLVGEGPPDLQLTHFDAHRVLFGPTRPGDGAPIPESARILESWAPLPLGFMRGDSV
ncbi:GNAT family N-acetyltransferase [bacterium]|nr:GNAT family N-acetyltransferase [bacterium]